MSARHASTRKIQAADLASKRRPVLRTDTERAGFLLHMCQARVVPLPEPPEVPRTVNGRPLRSWERELYREWAYQERRRELAMFEGLIG